MAKYDVQAIKPVVEKSDLGGFYHLRVTLPGSGHKDQVVTYQVTVKDLPDKMTYDWYAEVGDKDAGPEHEYWFVDEPSQEEDSNEFSKDTPGAFGINSNVFKELEFRWEMLTRLVSLQ